MGTVAIPLITLFFSRNCHPSPAQIRHISALAFLSGLVYGFAFLMKQPGLSFGIFGAAYVVWRCRRDRLSFVSGLKFLALFCAGLALPYVLLCLALAGAGHSAVSGSGPIRSHALSPHSDRFLSNTVPLNTRFPPFWGLTFIYGYWPGWDFSPRSRSRPCVASECLPSRFCSFRLPRCRQADPL